MKLMQIIIISSFHLFVLCLRSPLNYSLSYLNLRVNPSPFISLWSSLFLFLFSFFTFNFFSYSFVSSLSFSSCSVISLSSFASPPPFSSSSFLHIAESRNWTMQGTSPSRDRYSRPRGKNWRHKKTSRRKEERGDKEHEWLQGWQKSREQVCGHALRGYKSRNSIDMTLGDRWGREKTTRKKCMFVRVTCNRPHAETWKVTRLEG